MCGRFTLTSSEETLKQTFFDFETPMDLSPRYNIAPTQKVLAITNLATDVAEHGKNRQAALFHWGLIPSWAKDPKIGNRMINARCETLDQKPSFRNAYKRRRCLILADGYYEWCKLPGETHKQPVYIRMKSEEPFAFAGLWETWHPKSGTEPIRSCTIITCIPNRYLDYFHRRMPVILPESAYADWLAPEEQDPDRLRPLLTCYPSDAFEAYPVSRFVNRPSNDSPECIAPAVEQSVLN